MVTHPISPARIAVLEIPLITQSNYALISRSCNNSGLWFEVPQRMTLLDEIIFDAFLHIHDLLTSVWADLEHSLVEASAVSLLLGLSQAILVFVRANLHLLDKIWCGGTPVLGFRNLHEVHHIEWQAPLLLDSKLLAPVLTRLPIPQASIVVWGLCWNAGNDSCAFAHGDGEHWKDEDRVVLCQRRADRKAYQLGTCHLQQTGGFSAIALRGQLPDSLIAHVERRTLRANKDLARLHLEQAILTLWQHEAICLAIHGLRTKSCSNHVDGLAANFVGPLRWNLLHLQLDQCILGWIHSLPFCSVMIRTRLPSGNRVDCFSLA
mmetsp:Transcript_28388/g.65815  ORF Transcript_28388/g.65815 Transcript_28388/m.65815 type:complete len:321 (-) Transcript_28388:412-1374(-)